MSRHRGRSRPFTAPRPIFPRHCKCKRDHDGFNWFAHVVRTVAPPVLSVSKPSGLVDGDMLYMSGVPENVTPPEGWTWDGYGWRKEFRATR